MLDPGERRHAPRAVPSICRARCSSRAAARAPSRRSIRRRGSSSPATGPLAPSRTFAIAADESSRWTPWLLALGALLLLAEHALRRPVRGPRHEVLSRGCASCGRCSPLGVRLRALAWGAVAALTVLLAAAPLIRSLPLSLATRDALAIRRRRRGDRAFGALCLARPARAVARRVALWIEERYPSIEYTLVTAVETGNASLVPIARRRRVDDRRRVPARVRAPFVADRRDR